MDTSSPIVLLGNHVEIELVDRTGTGESLAFDIVPDSAADFASGFLGESTPLAKVLLGEREGSVIPYLKDDIFTVRIVAVTPSVSMPSGDAHKKREAKINKVIREVEHTNAIVFASSFSGKWGDYDPDSLPRDEETKDEDKPG